MRLAALLLALLAAAPVNAGGWHGAQVQHLDGWEGRYDAALAKPLFAALREKGANAVSLSAYAWQDSLSSTSLRAWDGQVSARAELAAAIRDAKAAGLAVFVKPHLEIGAGGKRNESAWRGEIRFEDAAAARAWFASYRSFLVDLARLCEEEKVELLAVGLELAGLSQSWPEEWRRLVAEVREAYSGKLTYCANWWGEFGKTELWSQLDLLGIQAFAPLSDDRRARLPELERGARSAVASWRAESERRGKPLVVTEYGYKSSAASWVEPWQWDGGRARPLAQQLAYKALLGALAEADEEGNWLAGSFVWLYEAAAPEPGAADAGFSPGGKPAERALAEWWRDARSGAASSP